MDAKRQLEIVRTRVAGVRYLLGVLADTSNREDAEAVAVLGYELDEAFAELDGVIEKMEAVD